MLQDQCLNSQTPLHIEDNKLRYTAININDFLGALFNNVVSLLTFR